MVFVVVAVVVVAAVAVVVEVVEKVSVELAQEVAVVDCDGGVMGVRNRVHNNSLRGVTRNLLPFSPAFEANMESLLQPLLPNHRGAVHCGLTVLVHHPSRLSF